jgi:hypothetical protein
MDDKGYRPYREKDCLDGRAWVVKDAPGIWMIRIDGIQWAPAGEPRDASGAGGATWPTRKAAMEAYRENERIIKAKYPEFFASH